MYFACGSIPRAKKQETQWMLWVFCDKLAYLHHEVDATSNLYLDAQIGMNTSQHDLSSMQVLLKLLLFMKFNLFITSLIDRSSTRSSTGSSTSSSTCASSFSWTSQFLTSFPNFSGTKWNSGLDHDLHEKVHQLFRKEGDVSNTFRGQNSMWKSTVTIASSIQCFKHHPRGRVDNNTSKVQQMCLSMQPNRACTNRFVLSRRCPALHVEISESTNQMHIPQQHGHLQRTSVFEPTSCTNRQCTCLDRFVVRTRRAH